MKNKYFVLLIIALLANTVFSQNENTTNQPSENFSEIKLNGLYLILGAFDVTYERTLNSESAIGVSLFLPFDRDVFEDLNFYLSPYYRMYFGKGYSSGFFIEGFGMLNSTERYAYETDDEKDIIDFAVGIGVGSKWVTNNNFIAELHLGFARKLVNSINDYDNEILGKAGVTLGYRF